MKNLLFAVFIIATTIACKQKNEDEKALENILNNPIYLPYTEAIKASPKSDSLYVQRGLKLMETQQFAAAVNDFKKAFDLNDNQDNALAYGGSLIEANKVDDAISFLSAQISKFPENPALRERLAFCYEQKGKFAEAIKLYDSILANDPEDFATQAMKGDALAAMDKDAEAIEMYKKSYAINPTAFVAKQLAYILAENQSAETVAFCNTAIAKDTGGIVTTDLIYAKGTYYLNKKDYKNAETFFDDCIKRDIRYTAAYLDKSYIQYEQKQYEAALKTAILGRQIDKNPELYYREGRCLEALGKPKDAITAYQDAIALDKNFTYAKEALANLQQQ
jgi:tetratricopeptide (TPR) repeat protein